jgi:hypothetical protein
MAAYFDGSVEEAAAALGQQVFLHGQLGSPAVSEAVKLAAEGGRSPESIAQALTWLFNPPTITTPAGVSYKDPAWASAGKALLGAGVGAAGGGVMSAFDEKKRKHWLRNILKGGLLGGGVAGGLRAYPKTSSLAI